MTQEQQVFLLTVASDLSWNEHISSVAKSAARTIGFLFRSKRFFTPLHLLTLYKAQICPCLEYGSHLWRGASKYSLASLDTIQKRALSTRWLTEEMSLPFRFTIDTTTAGAPMS